MRVEISPDKTRTDQYSFMVALISIPKLPKGIEPADSFMNMALVAINDVDGNEKYGGVFLTQEEKEKIGSELQAWDCAENKWHWCNLYHSAEAIRS